MPIGLLCLSACSCVHLYLKEPGKAGRIKLLEGSALDDSDDAEGDQPYANGNGSSSHNVDGAEEDESEAEGVDEDTDGPSWMVQDGTSEEGVPVEIEQWWYKVRLSKAALIVLLALTDMVACLALGWNAINNPKDTPVLVEDCLMVVYWVSCPCLRHSACTNSNLFLLIVTSPRQFSSPYLFFLFQNVISRGTSATPSTSRF